MKKIITVLVVLIVIVAAFLCYQKFTPEYIFTNESVTAVSENQELTLLGDSLLTITEGNAKRTEYITGNVQEYEGDFSVSGVKIGSSAKDFIKAFDIQKGQAMWETYLYKGPKEIIFNYPVYTGAILSREKYDDLFLTVGYNFDEKTQTWSVLPADDLRNIYNRDLEGADLKKYENAVICIVSAGFDADGTISQIDIDFGAYYRYNEYFSK